jgi:hypothetical protein
MSEAIRIAAFVAATALCVAYLLWLDTRRDV